jgi:hypothetical protein
LLFIRFFRSVGSAFLDFTNKVFRVFLGLFFRPFFHGKAVNCFCFSPHCRKAAKEIDCPQSGQKVAPFFFCLLAD